MLYNIDTWKLERKNNINILADKPLRYLGAHSQHFPKYVLSEVLKMLDTNNVRIFYEKI